MTAAHLDEERIVEPDPLAGTPAGLRAGATGAWRDLVRALIDLDHLSVRTPCDDRPADFVSDDVEIRHQAAKSCGLCPIRRQCGEFADANGERAHVWGGRDRTWGAATEFSRIRRRHTSEET